jgi:hypothetical protein
MAGYKTPKRIEIVDELPKNASGKILKRELRQRFAETFAETSGKTSGETSAGRSADALAGPIDGSAESECSGSPANGARVPGDRTHGV